MKRDSYSDQQAHASFQPQSSQPAIEPTRLSQPVHHSSSTSDLGAKWLNKASGWVADRLQTAQNFVSSGDAIAPDQILPALKGTVKPARSQADRTNQPLVGVIDAGFGTDEHGSKMVEAIQKENPQAKIWQGGGVGTGGGLESLTEFVNVAKATGQRAVANLSFDLTEVQPDGSSSTRAQLTAKEQSALAYARDNGVLVVASSGNQGGEMSALGQASQPSDNLIVVGAANGNNRASYSSYGNGLDLVAEVGAAGTSSAAATVTGTIAKLWSANPGLNSQQVEQMLTTTATDLKTPGWDAETGAGLLNSTGAITLATHTAPEAIVFSGAQLIQQVPGSLGGATWESRNGAVASEQTNRFIGDSPKEDAEIRAVLRSRTQANLKPTVLKAKTPLNTGGAKPVPKIGARTQSSLKALVRKDQAFNIKEVKPGVNSKQSDHIPGVIAKTALGAVGNSLTGRNSPRSHPSPSTPPLPKSWAERERLLGRLDTPSRNPGREAAKGKIADAAWKGHLERRPDVAKVISQPTWRNPHTGKQMKFPDAKSRRPDFLVSLKNRVNHAIEIKATPSAAESSSATKQRLRDRIALNRGAVLGKGNGPHVRVNYAATKVGLPILGPGGNTALPGETQKHVIIQPRPQGARTLNQTQQVTSVVENSGVARGVGRVLSRVAAPVGAAIDLYQLKKSYDQDGGFGDNFQKTAGSVAGAWGGAAAGAAIGTAIAPGVGTIIGGVVGGIAGSEVGDDIAVGAKKAWKGIFG